MLSSLLAFLKSIVCWGLLLALPCLMLLVGCSHLASAKRAEYVTVGEDTHGTDESNREHARAVKLLEKGRACTPQELEKVERIIKAALTRDVNHGPAHNNLGHVYFLQKRYYLAAWEYEFAHKALPQAMEPLVNLGLVHESVEQLDHAQYYYEQAHQVAPTHPEPMGNLARVLLKREEPLDTVRPLLEALILHDTRPEWTHWARDLLGRHPIPLATGNDADDRMTGQAPAPTISGPLLEPAHSPTPAESPIAPGTIELLPSPNPAGFDATRRAGE